MISEIVGSVIDFHLAWVNCNLRPLIAQVFPRRIYGFNQSNLFLAEPSFDLFFSTDCSGNILENFKVNQPIDIVPACESFGQLLLVLINAALKIVRDADVKSSRQTTQDVNVELLHTPNLLWANVEILRREVRSSE